MKSQHDQFADALRKSAADEQSPFSEELHAQVMISVKQSRKYQAASSRLSRWWWLAGAIACVVMLFIIRPTAHKANQLNPSPEISTNLQSLPPIPALGPLLHEVVSPLRNQLHDAQYAYLDRDGKRLANFLLRNVPGLSPPSAPSQQPQ
ncbi:MAG TPA: hypothetical protein VGG19_03565 [Tepidisphaeraceae bacterium]|jgi:hypothetical protein